MRVMDTRDYLFIIMAIFLAPTFPDWVSILMSGFFAFLLLVAYVIKN